MSLTAEFGLGSRELVALVGGGGKSTLMVTLASELSAERVLATTTTKMGVSQVDATEAAGAEFLARTRDAAKVTGPPPEDIDRIFATGQWDYVLVEADGSRGRSLKVPAAHEPVIPSAATLVVVVMGLDAVGRPLHEVAHRPEDATALLGPVDLVTAEHCAHVLSHRDAGLRGVPPAARVAVALTKAHPGDEADRISELLSDQPRIERVVVIPGI